MTIVKHVQLTREAIVHQALDILSSYGLGDLTMRRLAKQLGVVPGALYWHVPNKQALLEAIAEQIVAPLFSTADTLPAELGAEARLRTIATQLRQLMNAYRDGAEVVAAALPVGSLKERILGCLITPLIDAHLPAATARAGAGAVLDFVIGATLIEQSEALLHSIDRSTTSGAGARGDSSADEAGQNPSHTGVIPFADRLDLVISGVSRVDSLK